MAYNEDRLSSLKAQGNACLRNNQLAEAKTLFTRVCAIKPTDAEAWIALGNVNGQLGQFEEAAACCERAVALRPDIAVTHNNLGNVYKLQGRLNEALASYQEALRLDPHDAMAHSNLGILLKTMGRIDEATACLQDALRLDPRHAEAHNNLGNIHFDGGRLDKALACFQEALRLKPEFVQAYNNLGLVYQAQGRLEDALACYREALRLDPDKAIPHSNLLYVLNYRDRCDAATLFAEHVRWGERHGRGLSDLDAHSNVPDADRRLRVGYVSADFRNHPIAYFLEAVLAHRDKARFEIFCYNNRAISDDATRRLRRHADHWRDIVGQPDEAVARQIRRDGIDILVDLAGHTKGNRLLTFALKPAPVQATWIGYITTTGLKAMDYIIADRFVIPPEDEPYYVERPVRLPHSYLCFTAPHYPIEVSPLPALHGNEVTFGCFNNASKLTPTVIAVWAKLLHAVPHSRLFLKYTGLDDVQVQRHYRDLFTQHRIEGNRIRFSGQSPRERLLAAYREVDIALDPFPYNGGTTTVEALWMGVPVVSLRGDRFVSRTGETILTNIGLAECVADSEDAYIAKARALTADLPRLAELRSQLRSRLLNSPLCDGAGFTRDLEAAYRTMWKSWCLTQNPSAVRKT
jgi:predicted O-linked N-acetylglucosamine transferase (SPINDLY family)